MGSRARTAIAVVVAGLLLSGCLRTAGQPTLLVSPAHDGPDPAAVPVPGAPPTLQIFTTKSAAGSIPTWTFDPSTGVATSAVTDALPTIPAWSNGKHVWAPTVRNVAGGFLLMFTASRTRGQNCIGAATAPTVGGPYSPVTSGTFANGWCSSASNTAYLDPSLFVAADGTLWLSYSSQTYGGATAGDLYVVPLSSDGLQIVGAPALLVTFSDVARNVHTCGLGRYPRLENPSMVADPFGGVDLMASFGTYGDRCYSTVELPCTAINGGCIRELAAVLRLAGSTGIVSTGGASVAYDDSPTGNIIVFHGWVGAWTGTRFPYWDHTSCAAPDGTPCAAGGGAPHVVRLANPRRGGVIHVSPADPTTTSDRYHEPAP